MVVPVHTVFGRDLREGAAYDLGTQLVSEDDIVDFGRRWDPLALHTDRQAAASGRFGGVLAGPWAHDDAHPRVNNYRIELGQMHWRFKQGEQLRVTLGAGDAPRIIPTSPSGIVTVHHGENTFLEVTTMP